LHAPKRVFELRVQARIGGHRFESPRSSEKPEVIAALDKIGAEPASGSTKDLARAIKEEQERVAKAVAAAGIKPL